MAPAVFFDFLRWHYLVGISKLLKAWGNLHWFLYHYFSIDTLAKSFFEPFHRMQERKRRGFDVEDIAGVLIMNTVLRFIGMLVRSVFIILGVFAQIVMFGVGSLLFIAAVLAPALLVGLVVASIVQVVKIFS
ncbi:MAG: hypothetical protein AAB372_01455 [Patescibacteria group bacterium]